MTTTARRTARETQRLATRERLFDAAIAEFKRTGVAGADVGAIVGEAQVAHGTFFFHFPTKEHVVAELGQREEARMATELERFLATPRDLESTLREVLRLTTALERRVGRVLFSEMLGLYFSPRRPELKLWPEHPLIARTVVEFERGFDSGDLAREPEPANGATFFFFGLYGLLSVYDRSPQRSHMLDQLVTVVLRGVETR